MSDYVSYCDGCGKDLIPLIETWHDGDNVLCRECYEETIGEE